MQAKPYDEIILKENTTYKEKIIVSTPNLTLRGKNSRISYHLCHSSLREDGSPYGTTGSATFTVLESAWGFSAYGVTFENTHQRSSKDKNQAVAFKGEASHLYIEDCVFLSTQDTLYLDYGTDNIIKNSTIKGDIDFIFGSADALFVDCKVIALPHSVAYFTAPDTYVNRKFGFIFYRTKFVSYADVCYLGRRWFPAGAKIEVFPRIHFYQCEFNSEIEPYFITMHEGDPNKGVYEIKDCLLNHTSYSNIEQMMDVIEYISSKGF